MTSTLFKYMFLNHNMSRSMASSYCFLQSRGLNLLLKKGKKKKTATKSLFWGGCCERLILDKLSVLQINMCCLLSNVNFVFFFFLLFSCLYRKKVQVVCSNTLFEAVCKL